MNTITILALLFIHFIADFLCQTDYMALNKSKNSTVLLLHTGTYTVVMGLCIVWWVPVEWLSSWRLVLFLLATFSTHTIQDYTTSRITANLWKKEKRYWFFAVIGLDQWLHSLQLILCYEYLTTH